MTLEPHLTHLIVTAVFSFLVGLELRTYRRHYHGDESHLFFGTVRTYTLTGVIGYLFYLLEPTYLSLYLTLFVVLSFLYAVLYARKVSQGRSSILPYLIMAGVYAFGPLSERFALWVPSLLFVVLVFILNLKPSETRWTERVNLDEFETLGKMVLLSAVILPLLPNENTIPYLPISPFKAWLAVVVISAISYGGYLLQKYVFPSKGYFLTGLLGGTYSSTATTVVLARKARVSSAGRVIDASIVAATTMMYIRVLVVSFVFNREIAAALLVPVGIFVLLGLTVALYYLHRGHASHDQSGFVDKNPLELGTALLFGALFVVMMVVTHYTVEYFGESGLEVLSFLAGMTDIDPLILSLLTGKYSVTQEQIVSAILIAAGSNNLLKAAYALWFGGVKHTWRSAFWIAVLGIGTIVWAVGKRIFI